MRRMRLTLSRSLPRWCLPPLVCPRRPCPSARKILSVDHKVTVKSIVPAIAGQPAQIYVRERVAEGMKNPGARSRRVVRARRRHAGRSRVRRADRRLQLDGVSREGRLRRVLDGHHRLRPIDTAGADERSLQPVGGAAEAVRAEVDPGAVQGDVSGKPHDDRLRLERHRRRRRSHPQAAQRAEGQHGRVVARRTACRRLCGAASGQGQSPRAAGAGLQPRRRRRRPRRCRGPAPSSTRNRAANSTRTGIARSAARTRSIRKCAKWCGPRCSRRIRPARSGAAAFAARRRRRPGDSTRR